MERKWQIIAQRIVQGLGVLPGELMDVREAIGDLTILKKIALSVEPAGATRFIQLFRKDYLERWWAKVPLDYISHRDQQRQNWMK